MGCGRVDCLGQQLFPLVLNIKIEEYHESMIKYIIWYQVYHVSFITIILCFIILFGNLLALSNSLIVLQCTIVFLPGLPLCTNLRNMTAVMDDFLDNCVKVLGIKAAQSWTPLVEKYIWQVLFLEYTRLPLAETLPKKWF